MKATHLNVIIKEIKEEQMSASGLIMGNTRDVKFKKGEVIAFGDKVENVSVGDVVHFDGYRGSVINLKGEEYIVCTYDLIVIVE